MGAGSGTQRASERENHRGRRAGTAEKRKRGRIRAPRRIYEGVCLNVFFEVLRFLQFVRRRRERVGNDGVQHDIGIGYRSRRAGPPGLGSCLPA